MGILPIELYGSKVLRQVASPVDEVTPEIQTLLDDMVETMRYAHGAGLAANQVGVSLRIIVVDINAQSPEPEKLVYLINPELIGEAGEMVEEEGCLSLPEIYERVRRPRSVKVRALDREGNPFEIEGTEFLSKALCHELDHIDGVLFTDRLPAIKRDIVKRRIKKLIRDGVWDDYYEKKAEEEAEGFA